MKTLMYVANLIVQGELDIEGADRIVTDNQCVYAKNGRDYIDDHYLDSERLGPDKYDFELAEATFSVEEVKAYIDSGTFAAEHVAYQKAKREAVARVAELIAAVTPQMNELLSLANEYNIPADIKVGKYTNDFRLIDAVDWDSSSMYC
ncbi:hypothetical protein phiPsa374_139 [Pseudomonas phage phiPsa374]|uniref:Uncharacterized protein n=3 Tax=Otagovirus TaxID=2560197 RepID=A0A7G9V2D2_9CAUD|nr:hypothetical protein CF96_gp081 [Pseudomonas phage phiPsa374]YP_010767234.1 hypothetical protein QGX16_gp081 [Pseudomonas phage phiPsa397]YP_010767579.1 hypothetical protein QGX18_gp085 [Pseudomonas phage phiPsa347]AHJ87399.1 hypothetical protein phiPsa374_139 [Pseudomonas phage phiPsa374]QNO00438.1 hypothetical protein phiPsa347_143 [Pseudomonas phage phiPsa347]QNO00784.1 hypothetical protein phiPsa397_144 [Pseudomonas phage phiPsa397]